MDIRSPKMSETWPRSRACLTAAHYELKNLVKLPELHAVCSGRWTWVKPPVDEACRCPCGHPNRKAAAIT